MLISKNTPQKFFRATLLGGTAFALGLSMPAFAQEAADEDGANNEIIVTAQKREENLQDIPLAVSVIGGDAVAANGGLNLENAQYLVPSLNFRKSGTSLNQALFLRGVGTINFSIAAEPSVASCANAGIERPSANAVPPSNVARKNFCGVFFEISI